MGGIPWPILISILHRWVQYLVCGLDRPLGSRGGPSAIGPPLFGSSAVVWYVMCLDFLKGTLWVKFHGWYWYQSCIDGSNIWGEDRTDPCGLEMDHPPCALIFLRGRYGLDFMADIDINPSSISPIFGMWIGPTLGVPKWTICHWAAAIWW